MPRTPKTSRPPQQTIHRSSFIVHRSPCAFTLIEILVAVGIIALLIAILIPALSAAKAAAKKSATSATLANLQTALNAYFSDFNLYPPSSPPVTPIPAGRGPAALAEALMGYLPGANDGAGGSVAPYTSDPRLGFRTRSGGLGKIYGPYASDDPAFFRINVAVVPTAPTDASFLDSYGNEILYYHATTNATSATLANVFAPAGTNALFNSDDNLIFYKSNLTSYTIADTVPGNAPTPFFTLMNAPSNAITSVGTILGASSFLLISAGPDGTYFSADDILATNR